jgi:crotonobetainyl-CoA:carnitine CoA-transferase CaiB-like acyl-CoA transferase
MTTPKLNLLTGIRVLDASRVLAGPFCGQLLGDLGAEVLKVERPGSGDETRGWGPPFLSVAGAAVSAYYLSCNRNKRGLTLDLAQPAGVDIFHQLVQRSDVLLENFRPASADKLGVSPARLLEINPRLIVCSISGFGRTGPLRDLPGYDFAIQALSGLMSITGPPDGPPYKAGVAVTDIFTGLNAAIAVLACLQARERSGHGYIIDLALLDCAVAAQVNVAQAYLSSALLPKRQGNAHLQIVPYQLFATADAFLVLAVGNDSQWQHFCTAADQPDWADDERFRTNAQRVQHRDLLIPLVEPLLLTRTTAEWQRLLEDAGVPHAPVWNHADLFAHAQAADRGLRLTVTAPDGSPVDLVGSPFHVSSPGHTDSVAEIPTMPPELGEHTDQVLTGLLGLTSERINELRVHGIV